MLDSLIPRCQLHYYELLSEQAVGIDQEIKDIELFGFALREENRLLFETMMSESDPKALEAASLAKDPFEVIAMGLIFQQQKIIMGLIKKIGP